MAIQIKTRYTGRVENLIFYERLGDYLIRTVGQQTEATKRAAKDLGRASVLSKNLRRILSPIIPDPRDKKMQNKLTGAMGRFVASIETDRFIDLRNNHLAGFRFAADTFLSQCVLFPLNIHEIEEGMISIGIPEINPIEAIIAPEGTSKVEIIFMAATLKPDSDQAFPGGMVMLEIPFTNSLQASLSAELETGSIPGAFTVVAATMRYWNGLEQIRKQGFMPVEIVAAGMSG